MKFAIWILILLAVASLMSMFLIEFFPINTHIPNWKEVYAEHYGGFYPLMRALHLQDPYRSWWYQILLGLLSTSLLLCIIDRTPREIRAALGRDYKTGGEDFKPYHNRAALSVSDGIEDKLRRILSGYRVRDKRDGERIFFTADRGKLGHIGPLFTHIGMLLLVMGGLVAALSGWEIYGEAYPGEIIEDAAFDFKVRVDDFRIEYYPLSAGLWVLVDNERFGKIRKRLSDNKFLVEFYSHDTSFTAELDGSRLKSKFDIEHDRGNIKDYISTLTVIEDGEELFTKKVEVNKPLRYGGFRFYQSSFDTRNPIVSARADSAVIIIKPMSGNGLTDTMSLALDRLYLLPNGDSLMVTNFLPDFRITGDGAVSQSEHMRNPAVEVEVFRDGAEIYHQWSFLKNPFIHTSPAADYEFTLLNIVNPRAEAVYKTILHIKKNSGFAVIWAGLLMTSLGICLAFYVIPRTIWVVMDGDGEGKRLEIAGYSPKNKHFFREEFNGIVERLKNN